jgi:hypothetical protein
MVNDILLGNISTTVTFEDVFLCEEILGILRDGSEVAISVTRLHDHRLIL